METDEVKELRAALRDLAVAITDIADHLRMGRATPFELPGDKLAAASQTGRDIARRFKETPQA
jgi:plasmid stabilization system protein ParE